MQVVKLFRLIKLHLFIVFTLLILGCGRDGSSPNKSAGSGGSPNAPTSNISAQTGVIPYVYFASASQSVSENAGTISVAVHLNNPGGNGTIVVPYTVSGTATNPSDHTLASGSLHIIQGDVVGYINVPIVNDTTYEPSETVILTLGNPNGASLVSGTISVHTITITNDDAIPTVNFSAATQSALESVATMTVTAQLSNPSYLAITVPYVVTGTATAGGTDYAITASPITIAAGATTGAATITINHDTLDENDETVIATMGVPTNATAGTTTIHTATIIDDDLPPTVQWTAASQSGAENTGTMSVTAQLSAVSALDVTIPYAVTGTATSSADYTITASPMIITAGSLTTSVSITVLEDLLDEANETVVLTIGTPTNATQGSTIVHTATITDNDATPTVTFTSASQSAVEGAGTITITAQLSAVSGLNVTVPFTLSGTASNPADYTITTSPITITAGLASQNITISIVDDALDETNETAIVTMGAPTNATQGATTVHTATINDDDATPTVTFTAGTQAAAENTGTMTITAQLSAASGQDVGVPFTLSGTATLTTDYTITTSPITIFAGQTTQTITIAVVDDLLDEVNETVIVTMGTPTNATLGLTTVHTATINNNDAAPTVNFSTSSQTVAEGIGTATVTVTLSAASGQDVSIPYVITGTASGSGTDYTFPASPLVITGNLGTVSKNITVTIVDDAITEQAETVIATLSAPTNGTLGTTTVHTLTISTNDQTLVVNNTGNTTDATPGDGLCETATGNGICTLRAAIAESNAITGTQTISIPAATTIALGGTQLSITSAVDIVGGNKTTTVIDGASTSRVFNVSGGPTSFSTLTIKDGAVAGSGAGINVSNVTATISNVLFTSNSTSGAGTNGGGLFVTGAASNVTVTNSDFSSNTAVNRGGGASVDVNATAKFDYCSFISNTAVGGGGLFYDTGASNTVQRSLFKSNSGGTSSGGAIRSSRSLVIENNTITANTATNGGAFYTTGATVNTTLRNNTIAANSTSGAGTDTGGIRAATSANVTIIGNIISGNKTSGGGTTDNCRVLTSAVITSGGYNLTDNANSDCPITDTGDTPNGTPALNALGSNGGPTQTMSIGAGSDALEGGSNGLCPATDQRGSARPNGICDIGAFEL